MENLTVRADIQPFRFILCREHQPTATKMSTEPNKEESEKKSTEDTEVKFVPEGTFGGTIEKPIIYKKGKEVPEDTGGQGGGQN